MAKRRTFAGIDEAFASYEQAGILLQSIPYDGTSTWGKGADNGFGTFLDAVYQKVLEKSTELLKSGKYLTFFGGEHSVSIGIMEAFRKAYPNLTVLQLDAHADLREEYMGSPYNHACALHTVSKACNLIQVGIRSMDEAEKAFLNPNKCFFAHEAHGDPSWVERSIEKMTEQVYLTIDLDVLDPSIMPYTGTPEPGGMEWYTILNYLKKVFQEKDVVGFDIVEFSPTGELKAPGFLVAKLYYKLLSYKFSCTG